MNVAVFIIGAYMLLVALMGNGYALFADVKTQYDFLPWITAVFILYLFYEYSPRPIEKEVRLIIALGIMAYMIADYQQIATISNSIVGFLGSGKQASTNSGSAQNG